MWKRERERERERLRETEMEKEGTMLKKRPVNFRESPIHPGL